MTRVARALKEKRRLLLIDDDPNWRDAISVVFRDSEYIVSLAGSPAEGIRVLDEEPDVRVILLDLSFDGIESGAEVLDYVACRSEDYRVIILTAHEELLSANSAFEHGVFCYLAKSSGNESLHFAVDQAFVDLERAVLARKVDYLLRVQERIHRDGDVDGTLDLICEAVRVLVGAYTCHIRVYSASRGDFHVRGFAGPTGDLRAAFARPRVKGEFFSGKVVETRKAVLFDDLQNLSVFAAYKDEATSHDLSTEARAYFEQVASAYIVPISTGLFGQSVDAVLNVASEHTAFFTSERCAVIEELAGQAALAVSKDWLQKKRNRAYRELSETSSMLAAMADEVAVPDALTAIYNIVSRYISAMVQPEVVSIFRYDEATGLLEIVAEARRGYSVDSPSDEEYVPGESLTGVVFRDATTIVLPEPNDVDFDPVNDPRFDASTIAAYLRRVPSGQLKHYLGVPIRIGGEVRGVLRALNKTSRYYDGLSAAWSPRALLDRGFSPECRSIMEIAASNLGVAIRNVELLQEKDRQVERVRALGEVGRLISSKIDIDELLKVTIRKMAEVMQAEICMLFLKDPQGERLVLRQLFGIPETLLPNASYAFGEGGTGTVAATLEPRIIHGSLNRGKYDAPILAHLAEKHGKPAAISSILVVPVQARGQVFGVLKVVNKIGDDQPYNEQDLELFRTFADYFGIAIANAQIYKHANDRLAIAERGVALSLLVSAVAHEINNTSGVIPANVDGIREMLGTPTEAVSAMLDTIEDAASQATDFANEIAGFSANRRGSRHALDINEVIHEAVRALESQSYWDQATTSIELSLASAPLVCEIFRTPFAQVVRNIVINALQALDRQPGGRVRIVTAEGTGALTGQALIRFEDNGPGIRREHQQRIFEPEFSTKPQGNGLGLWLVRSQLEQVGGTIEVESALGHGAIFIVTIPLVSQAELP